MVMQTGLFHLLNMRQMPTGRRVFITRKMRKAAEALGATEIVDRCDEALAWDQKTMEMELAYLSDKGQVSRSRGEAQRFDQQIRSEEHTSELQSRPHLVCRRLP